MFLFLGNNSTVKSCSVVGVFNIEKCSVSKITNDFLRCCQKSGKIVNVSDDMPKSFIVCDNKTYISNVSNVTINKRAKKTLSEVLK